MHARLFVRLDHARREKCSFVLQGRDVLEGEVPEPVGIPAPLERGRRVFDGELAQRDALAAERYGVERRVLQRRTTLRQGPGPTRRNLRDQAAVWTRRHRGRAPRADSVHINAAPDGANPIDPGTRQYDPARTNASGDAESATGRKCTGAEPASDRATRMARSARTIHHVQSPNGTNANAKAEAIVRPAEPPMLQLSAPRPARLRAGAGRCRIAITP